MIIEELERYNPFPDYQIQQKMDYFYTPYNPKIEVEKYMTFEEELENTQPQRVSLSLQSKKDLNRSMNQQWWQITKLITGSKNETFQRIIHEFQRRREKFRKEATKHQKKLRKSSSSRSGISNRKHQKKKPRSLTKGHSLATDQSRSQSREQNNKSTFGKNMRENYSADSQQLNQLFLSLDVKKQFTDNRAVVNKESRRMLSGNVLSVDAILEEATPITQVQPRSKFQSNKNIHIKIQPPTTFSSSIEVTKQLSEKKNDPILELEQNKKKRKSKQLSQRIIARQQYVRTMLPSKNLQEKQEARQSQEASYEKQTVQVKYFNRRSLQQHTINSHRLFTPRTDQSKVPDTINKSIQLQTTHNRQVEEEAKMKMIDFMGKRILKNSISNKTGVPSTNQTADSQQDSGRIKLAQLNLTSSINQSQGEIEKESNRQIFTEPTSPQAFSDSLNRTLQIPTSPLISQNRLMSARGNAFSNYSIIDATIKLMKSVNGKNRNRHNAFIIF